MEETRKGVNEFGQPISTIEVLPDLQKRYGKYLRSEVVSIIISQNSDTVFWEVSMINTICSKWAVYQKMVGVSMTERMSLENGHYHPDCSVKVNASVFLTNFESSYVEWKIGAPDIFIPSAKDVFPKLFQDSEQSINIITNETPKSSNYNCFGIFGRRTFKNRDLRKWNNWNLQRYVRVCPTMPYFEIFRQDHFISFTFDGNDSTSLMNSFVNFGCLPEVVSIHVQLPSKYCRISISLYHIHSITLKSVKMENNCKIPSSYFCIVKLRNGDMLTLQGDYSDYLNEHGETDWLYRFKLVTKCSGGTAL